MASFVFCVFLGLLPWMPSVQGYSGGAPFSTCGHMTPGHYGTAEENPGPYSLNLSKSSYVPFEAVEVTINFTDSNDDFMGFLLMAVDADTEDFIGKFENPPGDADFACNSEAALTHNTPDYKQPKTFTWRAPSTGSARVEFRVTLVVEYYTYYVDIRSDILEPLGSSTPMTGQIVEEVKVEEEVKDDEYVGDSYGPQEILEDESAGEEINEEKSTGEENKEDVSTGEENKEEGNAGDEIKDDEDVGDSDREMEILQEEFGEEVNGEEVDGVEDKEEADVKEFEGFETSEEEDEYL